MAYVDFGFLDRITIPILLVLCSSLGFLVLLLLVLVLNVSVPLEVDLPLESLVAKVARERLVAGMLSHVGDEIGRLAEGLVAHHAHVGLLTWWGRGGHHTDHISHNVYY